MSAFGYLRLSRERDSSTSIDKQRESISSFCTGRTWHLIDWFEDVDVSGRKQSRPALDEMVRRIDEVDVIVFHRLDRIMRSAIGFAKLLEHCQDKGVELVSATEPFDTSTAMGRTYVWLLASVAEIEAENVSARVKATHEHLIRAGRVIGRGRSFGWRHDREHRTFVHVPDEVDVIREIVGMYLSGRGLQSIAWELTDRGIPTTYDGKWTTNAIRRIFTNLRLIGFMNRHGKPATDEPTLQPIIEVTTFRQLQAELARRTRAQVRYRVGSGELTGVVVCGLCGSRMYLRANGPSSTSYSCTKQRGHTLSISAPFLHEHIAKELFERLDTDKLAEAELALEQPDPDAELRGAIARLEWGREELMRDYYQESRIQRSDFEGQLYDLTERMEALRDKLGAEDDARVLLESQAAAWGDLQGLWPSMSTPERRQVFSTVLERIVVSRPARNLGNRNDPERIVASWRL